MVELNQNNNQEPEDIFAQSERTEAVPSSSNQPGASNLNMVGTKKNSRIWRTIIITLIILILAGAVYFLGNKFSGNIKSIFARLTIRSNQKTPVTPTPSNNIANSATSTNPIVSDSDHDGLSDAEEQTLGTNPNNPDTDGDGLYDAEEANVYHASPLKADTDGDGISDGLEVKQVTDPLNPALGAPLLDLQKAINNLK